MHVCIHAIHFTDTAMGVEMNALENGESDYVKAVYQVKEAIAIRQRTPWYWPYWLYNMLPVGRAVNKNIKLMHDYAYKVSFVYTHYCLLLDSLWIVFFYE